MPDDSPATEASTTPNARPFNLQFLSTKFLLALLFTLAGGVALFLRLFDPEHFNWLAGIVLGSHGASNIIDKKLNS
jgi:hypothetical protein